MPTRIESDSLSRHLRVRVCRSGGSPVDLTFNAPLAKCLGDLIPPDVQGKLKERGIDVDAIAADSAARNFAPGELFELNDSEKRVRVWLE